MTSTHVFKGYFCTYVRGLAAAAMAAALLAACSSNAADDDGTSGATVSPASCSERCGAKAKECGATESEGNSACRGYCGKNLTEDAMTCLEAESCGVLSSGSSECLKKNPPSSKGSDAGSNKNPSKRPPAPANFGNECKCPSAGGGVVIYCTDGKNCGSTLKCASGARCSYECKENDDCPSGSICTLVTTSSTSTRWCL